MDFLFYFLFKLIIQSTIEKECEYCVIKEASGRSLADKPRRKKEKAYTEKEQLRQAAEKTADAFLLPFAFNVQRTENAVA